MPSVDAERRVAICLQIYAETLAKKGSASRFGRPIRYRTRERTAYDSSIPMS